MNTSKQSRIAGLGKLAAGAVIAIGMMVAAGSNAIADNWKHNNNGHGQWHGKQWNDGQWNNGHGKHWKHKRYHNDYRHGGYHYYKPQRPRVVYVQPQPVYVAPPPVYYHPAPVYRRPEINIVFPLDFD
jgi:hypothetical protein